MVAKLESSIQDCQDHLPEFIHDGDAAREISTQGYQWEIPEEMLPQLVVKCVKTKMADA